jgi:Protein of unknown function (DUF3261)
MNADKFSRWRMGASIVTLSASLVTSACSHQAVKTDLGEITTPPVLTQNVLANWDARPFALTQLVRGTSQDTNYQVRFEIEWNQQTLTIVALTPLGLPIYLIQASATDTQVQLYTLPSDKQVIMDPSWILSDFLLAMAPVSLLQESLSDPTLHLLSATSRERILYRGDTPIIRISYSDENSFAGQLKLINLELAYHLRVDNLHTEELMP